MSGVTPLVDTLLATRLAQRLDLVPLKRQGEIASPVAAARVDNIANDVRLPSRPALEQLLGVGLSRNRNGRPGSMSPGFGGVTLSAVARAVSAILDPPMGPVLTVRSSEPLWLHSRPPVAHVLTARLAQTVTQSGLFYESHLQQFAAGLRSLEQMVREPQAGLALASLPAASMDATVVPLAAARPGAGDAGAAHGAGLAVAPSAAVPGADAQAVRSDPAPLAAVYGRDGRPGSSAAPFHEIAGQVPDAKAPVAGLSGDLDSSSSTAAAAIHPDAMGLVRQQLELLSVPVFRWSGEAWPGTPMEWDIQEEQAEDAGTSGGEVTQPAWTTNLTMMLPTLKSVAARLTLAGNTLQVRLACDEDATLAVLHEGRQALSRRFGPLGLQLTNLQVGMAGAEDGTGLPKS